MSDEEKQEARNINTGISVPVSKKELNRYKKIKQKPKTSEKV